MEKYKSNKNEVYAGYVRFDYSLPENKRWNFLISNNQILRGTVYNVHLKY